MKKNLLIAALVVALLASCSHQRWRGDDKGVNQTNPQVSVGPDGQIVVPYTLIFLGRQPVTITWRLPDPKFKFAENGIVVEGRATEQVLRGDKISQVLDPKQTEIVNCRRGASDQEFSCLNKHSQAGYYKYTIRLIDPSGKSVTLDPGIVND